MINITVFLCVFFISHADYHLIDICILLHEYKVMKQTASPFTGVRYLGGITWLSIINPLDEGGFNQLMHCISCSLDTETQGVFKSISPQNGKSENLAISQWRQRITNEPQQK